MLTHPHDTDRPVHSGTLVAIVLIVFTILGAGLGYLNSILVARIIGADGYQNYAVVIATVCILATLSEAGVGKVAMKVLPVYDSQNRRRLAAGYWRFAFSFSLSVSVLVALVVYFVIARPGETAIETAAIIGLCALPLIALSGVMIDFVMAHRAPICGTLVARLLVPLTSIVALLLVHFFFGVDTSGVAVACFALGSLVGVISCTGLLVRLSPPGNPFANPEYDVPSWLRDCASLAMFGFLSTWMFRVSVIVLKFLPVASSQVSQFAAAMETGLLILLLSKSTDKLFQPYMSMVIENREGELGRRLRNMRYRFVGSFCIAFLAVVFVFGEQILSLYGEEFRDGYKSLCFISVGAAVWTMFSLAPIYLQFTGQRAFVLLGTLAGAIMLLALSWTLGRRYGATGVSIAFCAVTSFLSFLFVARATKHFNQLGA